MTFKYIILRSSQGIYAVSCIEKELELCPKCETPTPMKEMHVSFDFSGWAYQSCRRRPRIDEATHFFYMPNTVEAWLIYYKSEEATTKELDAIPRM